MRAPGSCWRCGTPGVRSIGVRDYCGVHLADLMHSFDPGLWATNGIGLPCGLQRPEYGPLVEDLRCIACGAGWCGIAGERCEWCRAHREHLIAHQRSVLLTVPEVAEGAAADEVLTAWGERLRRGVEVGVILRDEAERVWRRAANRAA